MKVNANRQKQQLSKISYEKKYIAVIIFFVFFSCSNHIETGSSLSRSDIEYIKKLKLLNEDEKIYKFYSEYKNKVAGNFFTNKRLATYWIDERNKEKDEISFAFYPDIKSIDTIYDAGLTYSPYMLVTKRDNSKFKVSVNGEKKDIKSFFEEALKQWELHKDSRECLFINNTN